MANTHAGNYSRRYVESLVSANQAATVSPQHKYNFLCHLHLNRPKLIFLHLTLRPIPLRLLPPRRITFPYSSLRLVPLRIFPKRKNVFLVQ